MGGFTVDLSGKEETCTSKNPGYVLFAFRQVEVWVLGSLVSGEVDKELSSSLDLLSTFKIYKCPVILFKFKIFKSSAD